MLNLTQRLILGCAILAGLTIWLGIDAHQALVASGHAKLSIALPIAEVVVAIATLILVLQPIRSLARDTKGSPRATWSTAPTGPAATASASSPRNSTASPSASAISATPRPAAARWSSSSPTPSSNPSLSPSSSPTARATCSKLNQAATELLGEAATDRMALTNTPGGEKILSAIRDAVSMQKRRRHRRRGRPAAHAHRQARAQLSPPHHPHARLRRPLLGTVTALEDVTSLQDTTASRPSSSPSPAASCAIRCFRLRRGLYALAQGFGGELKPLQADISPTAPSKKPRSSTT